MKANPTNESFKTVRHPLILFATQPVGTLITKILLLESSDKTIFYHHFSERKRLKKNNPRS